MNSASSQVPAPAGDAKWYFVTIRDPELTRAASFSGLIARASKFVACAAVTMDQLEVVPGIPPEMQGHGDRWPTLTVDALYESLRSLTQFVWGDFFFFSSVEAADKADKRQSLLQMIDSSELTIRISDNMAYDVFTKSFPLVCDLLTDDWPAIVIKDELSRIFDKRRFFQ